MPYQFFFVPLQFPDDAADALNRFLASHKVHNVSREFVANDGFVGWSFCVQVAEADTAANGKSGAQRKAKIDYRLELEPELVPLFDAVRQCGSRLASELQMQAWQVVNNEQIYHMVRSDVRTLDDLKAIDGFGPKRVERYGEALLVVLEQARAALSSERL